MPQPTPAIAGFRHEALMYADQDQFLRGATSFIRDGLEAQEAMLVVVDAPKIDLIREQLNGDARHVHFADMREVGSNPARIIPAWREFVDRHASEGRAMRGIGEPISSARGPAELVECQRHESLLNLAFADTPAFYLLCPYDTASLNRDVIEEACRSHPFVAQEGLREQSACYVGTDSVAAPFAHPLPDPAVSPLELAFDTGRLGQLRRMVAGCAIDAGLSGGRTEELVLAVNELASNSIRHGGGSGTLRVWAEPDAVICEVADRGRIDHPLVGRERPDPGQLGGHGMWMVNQLCDLVQVRSFTTGSVVRLHVRR